MSQQETMEKYLGEILGTKTINVQQKAADAMCHRQNMANFKGITAGIHPNQVRDGHVSLMAADKREDNIVEDDADNAGKCEKGHTPPETGPAPAHPEEEAIPERDPQYRLPADTPHPNAGHSGTTAQYKGFQTDVDSFMYRTFGKSFGQGPMTEKVQAVLESKTPTRESDSIRENSNPGPYKHSDGNIAQPFAQALGTGSKTNAQEQPEPKISDGRERQSIVKQGRTNKSPQQG